MKFDPVPKVVRPRDAPCIVALPALLACREKVCGEPGMSRFRATLHAARPLTGAMKEPRSPLTAMYRVRRPTRSEEHTSELQSRLHLVCRLLLEKKKKHKQADYHDTSV